MIRLVAFAIGLIAAFGSFVPNINAAESAGHYFLVVDHSGSMLKKVSAGPESGRSRWDLMRDRSAGFVGRLPDGSFVWTGVFSSLPRETPIDPNDPAKGWLEPFASKLDSVEHRDSLTGKLRGFPEPALSNGTWLYQASNEALDQVEIAGERNPDSYLTVLVYTDGVDQGSGRTQAEMLRNPASKVTRVELEERIRRLRGKYHNFNVVNVYRPGDESILDAHVVRLLTNRFQLSNPLVQPKQEIRLGFRFNDDNRLKLEGRPLEFELKSIDEKSPLPPVRIAGGPHKLTNGEVALTLEKAGDWPSGQDVRIKLMVKYPAVDGFFLVEEGGNTVDLMFQGAKAPTIRDLLPVDGSAFPVGREIAFSLTSLSGCEVEWNFGDGASAKGSSVSHRFAEPGSRRVMAKVTDPETGLSATGETRLVLTELDLKLDPLPIGLIPGRSVTLYASSKGAFRGFEWDVGGHRYAGKPRSDGSPGTALELSFDRPGVVPIRLTGFGEVGGRVETEVSTLTVNEVPAIRLTSPSPEESLYFGSQRELRAEIEGVQSNQLRFSLTADGKELIPPRNVDVKVEGKLRSALMTLAIPTLPSKTMAKLSVEALGAVPPLKREIPVRLESEPASLEIVLPEGREPRIGREVSIRMVSNVKLEAIRWNFGDGWRDGNEMERHRWAQYGVFTVQALAKGPDGTELIATPVEVRVPVCPVRADAAVIYKGRRVGSQVSKVPVNSTLELQANAEGDVVTSRWLLDGIPLPPGQQTVTVKSRGFKTLQLVVDGTPEAGGPSASIATVEFRTSDKILFWVLTAGGLVVLGLTGRLLLGNKWRFAELQVGKEVGRSHSDGGTLKMPWGIRSWWTKRAEIYMSELDKKTCPGWQGDSRVRFEAGKDPKLQPLGREWGDKRLEPENSKLLNKGEIKRWTFPRKPLTRVRPDHEYRVGTINLTIPQLKPGIVGRWPEFLFFGLAAGLVAGLRLLVEWLY